MGENERKKLVKELETQMTTNKKWSIQGTIDDSNEYIKLLEIPSFGRLAENPDLIKRYSQAGTFSNKELEEMIAYFSGHKRQLEIVHGNRESALSLYNSVYNESCNAVAYQIQQEREAQGLKKFTGKEIDGAIGSRPQIKDLKQSIMRLETDVRKIKAELEAMTTGYNGISRVISVRTMGANNGQFG